MIDTAALRAVQDPLKAHDRADPGAAGHHPSSCKQAVGREHRLLGRDRTRDIEILATVGITKGCGPDIFCPNEPVTRGQMAAFLVRALGYTDRGNVDFTDDNGSVFEADIEQLATAGVTTGCGPATFCPNDNVTRGQMAAFLHRALGGGVLYPNSANARTLETASSRSLMG